MLREASLRATRRREIILRALKETGTALTAEEVFQYVREQLPINLSTGYRALSSLTEKGVLLRSCGSDGRSSYQLNGQKHCHQLVCTVCSRKIPISRCPVEALRGELQRETGFIITGHSLEFTGICPECARRKK